MPCDTKLKPRQTIQQRAEEIRRAVATLAQGLATNRVRVNIGPTGGVAFVGLTDQERDGVTDACMYRRVMATGSALAKAKIAAAEALSGRSVNRQAVAHGHHSHDNGQTWHTHKG
jgi:hypothetical protein